MKKTKLILSLLLVFIMVFSIMLAGCSGDNSGNEDADSETGNDTEENTELSDYSATFTLTTGAKEGRSWGIPAKIFKDKIEKATNGKIKIDIFYDGVLCAGERESFEEIKAGNIDMGAIAASPLNTFVPTMGVFDLNFLFKDYDHAHKVIWGEIGDQLLQDIEDAGFVALAWMEDGFSYLSTSKKPVSVPEDVKGMKIRVMESPILVYTWKDVLGADAFPLSWAELYMALQKGVAEGQMNSFATIVDFNFTEVQDYINMVAPIYQVGPLTMNKEKFEAMPEDIQQLFRKCAKEAVVEAYDDLMKVNEEYEKKVKDENLIEINDNVDMDKWIEAAAPAIDYFAKENGWEDLVAQIRALGE